MFGTVFFHGTSMEACFMRFVYVYLCTVLDKKALKTRELNAYNKSNMIFYHKLEDSNITKTIPNAIYAAHKVNPLIIEDNTALAINWTIYFCLYLFYSLWKGTSKNTKKKREVLLIPVFYSYGMRCSVEEIRVSYVYSSSSGKHREAHHTA